MPETKLPPGWDSARVQRVAEHYESQSEEEAVAEDEVVLKHPDHTVIEVPNDLVPAVRELIAKHHR